jgi:hypothetical protein
MSKGKSSISKAASYEEMGLFWDAHGAEEFWEQTKPAEIEFDIRAEKVYFPVGKVLAQRLAEMAREEGVSAETLLNLWIQDRLNQRTATSSA